MHAGKTLKRPGATPLWTAFSRPSPCGVAPGLSPQNGDRVLLARRNRRNARRETERKTKPTRRKRRTTWQSSRHHPNNQSR
jgi:hypothetical protein